MNVRHVKNISVHRPKSVPVGMSVCDVCANKCACMSPFMCVWCVHACLQSSMCVNLWACMSAFMCVWCVHAHAWMCLWRVYLHNWPTLQFLDRTAVPKPAKSLKWMPWLLHVAIDQTTQMQCNSSGDTKVRHGVRLGKGGKSAKHHSPSAPLRLMYGMSMDLIKKSLEKTRNNTSWQDSAWQC